MSSDLNNPQTDDDCGLVESSAACECGFDACEWSGYCGGATTVAAIVDYGGSWVYPFMYDTTTNKVRWVYLYSFASAIDVLEALVILLG
ncbi:hypothetical protein Tco_0384608 [Tanacetum coccineum]